MNFYISQSPGFLSLAGEHRLDFLQRQTSNDLRPLAPGRAIQTVLASATGRILDVLTVLDAGDSLGVITLPGRASQTFNFLKSRIFFMDRVTLTDESARWLQVDVFDAAILQHLRIAVPRPGEILQTEWGGVLAHSGLVEEGFRFFAAPAGELLHHLESGGGVALSSEAHDLRRIERGYPSQTTELSEAFTPLEVGLQTRVAENKGCYTGQEVLARQVNYDKITRHLAGIVFAGAVDVGAAVLVDKKNVGEITSCAVSAHFGPIALAVLRRPHHEPGTSVTVGDVGGRVVALPFV
jgi:tRNA-modifying protein YgfZ